MADSPENPSDDPPASLDGGPNPRFAHWPVIAGWLFRRKAGGDLQRAPLDADDVALTLLFAVEPVSHVGHEA